MGVKLDLSHMIGKKFGKLTVCGEVEKHNGERMRRFLKVKCSCGSEEREIRYDKLMRGETTSCECIVNFCKAHKLPRAKLRNVWFAMVDRCTNKDNKYYKSYGGRGIKVSKEWLELTGFLKWVIKSGYKNGLTLERNDNNEGYSDKNCRWATMREQGNNRRTNVNITHNGITLTISEWSRKTGINRGTLGNRYRAGVRGEKLFRKVGKNK